jgi:hypothetical protein
VRLSTAETLEEFLTIPAYEQLVAMEGEASIPTP